MADFIFMQAYIALCYLAGATVIGAPARLFTRYFPLDAASILVVATPLACLLVAEGVTRLWLETPGALGLGGLNVAAPALLAGMLAALAAAAGHGALQPLDTEFPRDSEDLTRWLALAFACAGLALCLWRFWPEPRARLF